MRLPVTSRFYKQFFMYLSLCILTLMLLSLIIYSDVMRVYEQEVQASNRKAVAQAATLIDSRFRDLEELITNLSGEDKLRPYALKNNPYAELEAMRELKKYRTLNAFVSDIAFHSPYADPERIYTTTGVYNLNIFFDYAYALEGFTADDLNALYTTPRFMAMRNLSQSLSVDTSSVLLGQYQLPLRALAPIGTVLLFIEEEAIDSMISEAFLGWDSCFVILSETDGLLYSHGSLAGDPGILAALTAPETGEQFTLDGEAYTLLDHASTLYPWQYRIAVPTQQTLAGVIARRNVFFGALAGVALLGLGLSLLFSRANVRQLRRLTAKIPNVTGEKDELAMIARSVDEMLRENEGLNAQIRTHQTIARRQYLLSLLLGLETPHPPEDISPLGDYRIVMLLSIDDQQAFEASHDARMRAVLRFSLCNVLEKAASPGGWAVDMPDGRTIALILTFAEESGAQARADTVALAVQQTLAEYYDLPCTLGIGGLYEAALVSRSYSEATEAVRYRASHGQGQILHYVKPEQEPSIHYPSNSERLLSAALRAGDSGAARDAVTQAFDQLRERRAKPAAVQGVSMWLLGAILQAMDHMSIAPDAAFQQGCAALADARDEASEQREALLLALAETCCHRVADRQADQEMPRGARMLQAVLAHYRDPAFSLHAIADQFGVSDSYATTLFKEQTGMPLMSYVDALRLKDACTLLRETDQPLREVVSAVGYGDVTAFIRKFKQAEGMTPAVYRRMHQKQQENA